MFIILWFTEHMFEEMSINCFGDAPICASVQKCRGFALETRRKVRLCKRFLQAIHFSILHLISTAKRCIPELLCEL